MKIINREEIQKAAKECIEWNGDSVTYVGFQKGVEFAESKFEEIVIEFGEYLMKLNNNVIKKETNLKPLDSSIGPKLVKDMFELFIKERNEQI